MGLTSMVRMIEWKIEGRSGARMGAHVDAIVIIGREAVIAHTGEILVPIQADIIATGIPAGMNSADIPIGLKPK